MDFFAVNDDLTGIDAVCTKDGTGKPLSLGPAAEDDDAQEYRNSDGYVLTGPEYLTVFEGATGKELATESFPVLRGSFADGTFSLLTIHKN